MSPMSAFEEIVASSGGSEFETLMKGKMVFMQFFLWSLVIFS